MSYEEFPHLNPEPHYGRMSVASRRLSCCLFGKPKVVAVK
jgi:hypothetical protein